MPKERKVEQLDLLSSTNRCASYNGRISSMYDSALTIWSSLKSFGFLMNRLMSVTNGRCVLIHFSVAALVLGESSLEVKKTRVYPAS